MSGEALRRRAPGLGRGLSALLGDVERDPEASTEGVQMLAVADIAPDPGQPRRHFDDTALDELASSILAHGVIQPIVVRAVDGGYRIVAGERRWRAAQLARLDHIPALIRAFDDATTLEVSLLENIQREQLNAVEEGEAYRRLITDFGHSPDALGKLLHKSRSHVANLIRLLDLPQGVRAMIADGRLSMGHARTLIGHDDAEGLANAIVAQGLSVRAAEALVKRTKAPPRVRSGASGSVPDSDIALLERQLGDLLGLKVAIAHAAGAGTVTLRYATLDQLDMVCQRLSGEKI